MSQTAFSSSLQISTLPAQFGHVMYSGLGRRNFLIPGHDSELGLSNTFHLHFYASFSPFTLIVSWLKGTLFPEISRASLTRRVKPKQHGTSMVTILMLCMLETRKISANLFL
jgi:hypothetical protein